MATASRLLPPFPPPAAPTSRHATLRAAPRSCSLAIPSLRCRASAPAAVDAAGAPLLLEDRAGTVSIREFVTLDELHAAVRLRVRTFYEYARDTVGAEDHRKGLAEREYEALQNRISGNMINFRRVSCINGTVPLLPSLMPAEELCSTCKVTESSHTRAYLSNVCVAKELQRCGLGYALVDKSKKLARQWGITDLYVHVAINNEAAQKLYIKSGFVYESEEPAQQARHLGRPRRLLLWLDMKNEAL
ncbi:uncharacterized protein LOC123424404 isoform X2 [Hordeum vulgare subsp. vulgare]|uniref:uncharacterized protein LOC123424404 isoform X2 n=1 Tax=Hordeum vulgare subsp. vulgare TaxID=112509 RepID=UPI001D1A3B8C|nr:uncharacterized protein LOC123424404 isoform X2 [Hordeum vulgare subsp. vulgare]